MVAALPRAGDDLKFASGVERGFLNHLSNVSTVIAPEHENVAKVPLGFKSFIARRLMSL
jgi:hypothetical protein